MERGDSSQQPLNSFHHPVPGAPGPWYPPGYHPGLFLMGSAWMSLSGEQPKHSGSNSDASPSPPPCCAQRVGVQPAAVAPPVASDAEGASSGQAGARHVAQAGWPVERPIAQVGVPPIVVAAGYQAEQESDLRRLVDMGVSQRELQSALQRSLSIVERRVHKYAELASLEDMMTALQARFEDAGAEEASPKPPCVGRGGAVGADPRPSWASQASGTRAEHHLLRAGGGGGRPSGGTVPAAIARSSSFHISSTRMSEADSSQGPSAVLEASEAPRPRREGKQPAVEEDPWGSAMRKRLQMRGGGGGGGLSGARPGTSSGVCVERQSSEGLMMLAVGAAWGGGKQAAVEAHGSVSEPSKHAMNDGTSAGVARPGQLARQDSDGLLLLVEGMEKVEEETSVVSHGTSDNHPPVSGGFPTPATSLDLISAGAVIGSETDEEVVGEKAVAGVDGGEEGGEAVREVPAPTSWEEKCTNCVGARSGRGRPLRRPKRISSPSPSREATASEDSESAKRSRKRGGGGARGREGSNGKRARSGVTSATAAAHDTSDREDSGSMGWPNPRGVKVGSDWLEVKKQRVEPLNKKRKQASGRGLEGERRQKSKQAAGVEVEDGVGLKWGQTGRRRGLVPEGYASSNNHKASLVRASSAESTFADIASQIVS